MPGLTDLNGTYAIDPTHTQIGFVVRHAMVTNVRGHFEGVSGLAKLDGSNPSASSVTVSLDAATVKTGNADRDAHLVSPDFFDAATFPELTFSSTGVTLVDDENVVVKGNLTIKDVTREVELPLEFTGRVTDPWGQDRIGFEGQLPVNRKDFGLTWNAALEAGGVLVSDKVKLTFEVSAVAQAA